MVLRHLWALEIAASLVWSSPPARPTVLGVVVEADHAHLNATIVTAGSTVYDGDNFSTETGGMLLLRGDAAMLRLADDSNVIVRSDADGAQGTEAGLGKGTLAFSAARAAALEIIACEARIRASTDDRTVAQVSVTGPKELRIYARRGALQFSYRGETKTTAEGESYRVILDPRDDDPSKKKPVPPGRRRKTFLFFAIGGGAAAATAVILHENHRHKKIESPDRP